MGMRVFEGVLVTVALPVTVGVFVTVGVLVKVFVALAAVTVKFAVAEFGVAALSTAWIPTVPTFEPVLKDMTMLLKDPVEPVVAVDAICVPPTKNFTVALAANPEPLTVTVGVVLTGALCGVMLILA